GQLRQGDRRIHSLGDKGAKRRPIGARSRAIDVLGVVGDRGSMGQQLPERNGCGRRRRNGDPERQIGIDVVVEVKLSLIPQLHQRRGGDRLRYRRDQGQRVGGGWILTL